MVYKHTPLHSTRAISAVDGDDVGVVRTHVYRRRHHQSLIDLSMVDRL